MYYWYPFRKKQNFVIYLIAMWIFYNHPAAFAQKYLFQPVDLLSSTGGERHDHKCGFPTILMANSSGNTDHYQELQLYKLEPTSFDSIYFSPTGHFKIYYSTTGFNAIPLYDRNQNNVSDYLEFLGKSFDRAWSVEIDSLGFNPPPDSSGMPRSVYPIFCRRLSVYGQTWLDYEIPQLLEKNYVTYIEINTNFNNIVEYPGVTDPIVRDSMAIAVTAAHEFNHAIQSGYRLWPENNSFYDLWFIESSATYMEEVVAPEVNDYLQYLEDYFNHTNQPLDYSSNDFSDYGKVVFEIMLGKQYGPKIVREIWAEILQYRALPSIENVLPIYGSDLAEEMKRLSSWLYFSGPNSLAGEYFPDSPFFPSLKIMSGSPIKSTETILMVDSLPRLSFQWYHSESEKERNITLLLKAGPASSATELYATCVDPFSKTFYQFPASLAFDLPFNIGNLGLPFNVLNTSRQSEEYFDFQIISRSVESIGSEEVIIYPQPLKLSVNQPFLNFKNVPESARVTIFNAHGKYLVTLKAKDNHTYLSWDLKTRKGELVGSGVYLYHVHSDGMEKTGKFVIIE